MGQQGEQQPERPEAQGGRLRSLVLRLEGLAKRLAVCGLLFGLPGALAQDASTGGDFERRFDAAWRLVAERYWDLGQLSVDWDEVRARYAPEAAAVSSEDELHALLSEMYEELGDNHSVFVPPARLASIREIYGDLPCLGVFGGSLAADDLTAEGVVAEGIVAEGIAPDGLTELGNVAYRLLDVGFQGGGVGYVRLPDLVVSGSAQDLRAAVRRLTRQGAEALILDLRGNPGGRLLEMMQAAGVFARGFLWRVVTTWTLPLPYPALGGVETELPLAVLVDGGVNSAAEGLAGALQASGRATIIGQTTAGNVEAVMPFCLRDGAQAWIATGVLAPLLGATWEGRGVVPDVATAPEEALATALELFRDRSE